MINPLHKHFTALTH